MTIRMIKFATATALISAVLGFAGSASAETVMQQCSAKYQAAKLVDPTVTWSTYLPACRAEMKATPAAATDAPVVKPNVAAPVTPVAPVAVAPPVVNPLKPTVTATPVTPPVATTPVTGGRGAEQSRQKTCGAEWRANKVALKAQTPGITWPKYWHECNMRMKAAGQ